MVVQTADPTRRQTFLIEYEILDSFWTHQHQWIWLSTLVLITLSMLGMTFLPVGLAASPLKIQLITFVAAIAIILTFIWWGILRQMLSSLRVVQHRKREIEKSLGMRMELYLSASRFSGKRARVRALAQEEAGDDPELRADLADFLRSAGGVRIGILPGEEVIWNLLPVFFIGAWIAFWFIVTAQ